MGKKTVHVVHVTPETKLLHANGSTASFEELVAGAEVRGAYHKRADGEVDAGSLKIGPKIAEPNKLIDEDSL